MVNDWHGGCDTGGMQTFYCPLLLLLALPAAAAPQLSGCPVLPADNIWNVPVDTLPRHPSSDTFVATIGAGRGFHPDFGTVYEGAPIGIPYVTVPGNQPKVAVTFDYDDESDPGPYPIPPNPPIEGGSNSHGDRHILMLDRDNCRLYELYYAFPDTNGTWRAGSGAIYDLRSNALRPSGWTSADAAGLPILPGLVRYEEVASGEITHALRFTVPQTHRSFVWPARHFASSLTGAQFPPMGLRMRLKAGFDTSGFAPSMQVILRALKKYGMILADNGSAWYISGVPDPRWDDDTLVSQFSRMKGSDFEAVDASSLMVEASSGQAKGATTAPPTTPAADWTVAEYYHTVIDHFFMTGLEAEKGFLDGGGGGGWQRTGTGGFKVWSAAPGAAWSPVCRFYGNEAIGANGKRIGPNSHFYTIEPGECALVKTDPGWVYEGVAFYARRLESGACPAPLRALHRAYNNGYPLKDSNHRFAIDRATLDGLVRLGWSVEGAVMCVE